MHGLRFWESDITGNYLQIIAKEMQDSLVNEGCVDLPTGKISACFPKPAEDQTQECEMEKETVITKRSKNKDTNSAALQCLNWNSDWTKKVHECPVCHKRFGAPSKLRRHILIHTHQKPYQCPICCHAFRDSYDVNVHMIIHSKRVKQTTSFLQSHGSNIVPCGQTSRSTTKISVCNHTGNTPCVSERLTPQSDANSRNKQKSASMDLIKTNPIVKIFNVSESDLKTIKGYWCPTCLKRCNAPSKLKRHMLIHTKIKPFKCFVCSRDFRQKSHLNLHKCQGELKLECNYVLKQVGENTAVQNAEERVVSTTVDAFIKNQETSFKPGLTSSSPDVLKPVKKRIKQHQEVSEKSEMRSSAVELEDIDTFKDAEVETLTSSPVFLKCKRKCVNQKKLRQAFYLDKDLKFHTEKGNSPSKLCEVWPENEAQYSTAGHLDGSNNCRLDGNNASPPQILEFVDTQTTEKLQCMLNQNVHSTEMPSIILKIVSNKNDTKNSKDTNMRTSTSTRSNLTKGKGVNQCNICQKIFPYPSKLSRHLLIHTGERQFKCNVCSKSFQQPSHLQTHQMIHKKRIPPSSKSSKFTSKRQFKKKYRYQCEICLKIFRHVFYLEKHLEFHTEEGPSKLCEVPPENGAQYSTPGHLDGSNNCGLDGDNVSPAQILEFVDTQTEEMLECNNMLNQNVPLTETASVTVEIEGNDTDTEENSDTDAFSSTKGENQCTICLKIFSHPSRLSRHLLIHTGERHFKCNVCSKSFRQRCHLQTHQMIHNRKGQDIAAWHKEQDQKDYVGNAVTSKDQVSSQDGADDLATAHQDQNIFTNNTPSQKTSGDSNDSGIFYSSGTSLLENVQVNSTSEVAFQCSNNYVCGLTHNTDISSLVEKKASDIVPLGWVSDCPPKTESSLPCWGSDSTTEENWRNPKREVEEKCSVFDLDAVKRVHESYLPRLYPCSQKNEEPDPRQEVVGLLEFQETNGHFTQPPQDILVCPDCSQCFPTESELYTHVCANKRPDEKIKKSHQCHICFKVFNAPSKLKRHGTTHTGQRPFQCTLCQKSYTQSHHLKTHMLCHR